MSAYELLAQAIVRAKDADDRYEVAKEERERLRREMVRALENFYDDNKRGDALLTQPSPVSHQEVSR